MAEKELHELLGRLHAELERTDSLDEASRHMLATVMTDIAKVLSGEDGPAPTEADESLVDRLRKATLDFEGAHPQLVATLDELSNALNRMGL